MKLDRPRALLQLLNRLDIQGPDECWEFQGYRQRSGHGQIRIGGREGKLVQAHRLSYRLFHGEIPSHLVVRHQCHNAACCNPAHLQLGTQEDNVRDAIEAGRHYYPFKPLGWDEVEEKDDPAAF